jgi:hypothetical protein
VLEFSPYLALLCLVMQLASRAMFGVLRSEDCATMSRDAHDGSQRSKTALIPLTGIATQSGQSIARQSIAFDTMGTNHEFGRKMLSRRG